MMWEPGDIAVIYERNLIGALPTIFAVPTGGDIQVVQVITETAQISAVKNNGTSNITTNQYKVTLPGNQWQPPDVL